MVRVLFFGRLKEITKKGEIKINNCKTLEELKNFLFEKYPDLKREIFFIALNQSIINDEDIELKDKDEVAFLPPVSGG